MIMLERVITATIVSLIITGVPALYNLCKKNKIKKDAEGKVYFGVFRIILLYIVSIISSEGLLFLIFGTETIEGIEALLLTLICSIPFMYIYVLISKKIQERKLNKDKK